MKKSGVLMHISSLPSPYGIGTLGRAAEEFIDFLADSGQSFWQILPICPTGFGDSPYQSFSSFAGNPYLVDLDRLAEKGLLNHEEYCCKEWGQDALRVDFGVMNANRVETLKKAVPRLIQTSREEFETFCAKNSFWLDEYAVFMSLKTIHGGAAWTEWMPEYRTHDSLAVREFTTSHSDDMEEWKAIQFLFFSQWHKLKSYAESRKIRIIGDMPIYVSLDSADVWAHPELFQLGSDGRPSEVSGCPPDGFSAVGQLWGNPLFNWDLMREDGYSWWISRISYLSGIYHVLRIDHFRGFDSYYAIPYGSDDARKGVWRQGPGIGFFRTIEKALGKIDIIAEDLGFLTDSVKRLREDTGYPGMKVLEMAFDHRDPVGDEYLPENFIPHCVAYIGTHDNDTALGWIATAPEEDVRYAISYLGLKDPKQYNWEMMRILWNSAADLTIVQAQDLLDLGTEARMNRPSVPSGNWQWRASSGSFTSELSQKIHSEMERSGRL